MIKVRWIKRIQVLLLRLVRFIYVLVAHSKSIEVRIYPLARVGGRDQSYVMMGNEYCCGGTHIRKPIPWQKRRCCLPGSSLGNGMDCGSSSTGKRGPASMEWL